MEQPTLRAVSRMTSVHSNNNVIDGSNHHGDSSIRMGGSTSLVGAEGQGKPRTSLGVSNHQGSSFRSLDSTGTNTSAFQYSSSCDLSLSSWDATMLAMSQSGKLYGREKETALLEQAYQKNCLQQHQESDNQEQSHIVLVTGVSGTGKTALARSLESTVQRDGGLFLLGKNDQIHSFNTDQQQAVPVQPYAPFAVAFDRLLRNTDNNDDSSKPAWQRRMLEAIQEAARTAGTTPQVLADAIPALRKLFREEEEDAFGDYEHEPLEAVVRQDHQDAAALLLSESVTERSNTTRAQQEQQPRLAKSRNNVDIPTIIVFCEFIKAFCSPDCHLVLVLDDLQWLDSSSLALFKALAKIQGKIPGFFLIGTCRGNEVGYEDDLSQVLRSLEKEGSQKVHIQDIPLTNLGQAAFESLVSDLVPRLPESEVRQVAQLVLRQTRGDIFYSLQVLRDLHDKNAFDVNTTHAWKGGTPASIPINIEVPANNIDTNNDCANFCSAATIQWIKGQKNQSLDSVLMIASCLGAEFSQRLILAGADADCPPKALIKAISLLERRGLLVRRKDQTYNKSGGHFGWAHDRFQQVAYSLIPETKRDKFHNSLGLALFRNLPPTEVHANQFLIINQFCLQGQGSAGEYVAFQDESEKVRAVALCVVAGETAARTSAFDTARVYFRLGLTFLGPREKAFESHYTISLRLFNAAAEMECCMGNFCKVSSLVAGVLESATSLQDKLRAYETEISALGSQHDVAGAVRVGLKVLKELGENFPSKPFPPLVIVNLLKAKRKLRSTTADEVVNMKPLADWRKAAALRIIFLITHHLVHQRKLMLVILVITRGIDITLKHGVTEMAAFGFFGLGTVMCKNMGEVEEGIRVVEIGRAIVASTDAQFMKCRGNFCKWGLTKCFQQPFKESILPLKEAAQTGFMSGDTEVACECLYAANSFSLLTGANLADMAADQAVLHEQFALRGQARVLNFLMVSQQAVQNLRGLSKYKSRLTGDFLSEQDAIQQSKLANDESNLAALLVNQCMLAVYFNDHPAQLKASSKKLRNIDVTILTSVALMVQSHFVSGLAEVMASRKFKGRGRRAGKKQLQILKKLAKTCPENVSNKVFLIEAEQFALRGRRDKALAKFQLSIDHADRQGFVHEKALACERTAMALNDWGEGTRGIIFLQEALSLYESWGAQAKVEQLVSILQKAQSDALSGFQQDPLSS